MISLYVYTSNGQVLSGRGLRYTKHPSFSGTPPEAFNLLGVKVPLTLIELDSTFYTEFRIQK